MLNTNKNTVTSVSITNYDEDLQVYMIKYDLSIRPGVVRRRTAKYSHSEGMSKDSDNEYLVKRVKQEVNLFSIKMKSY